jgi:hypothetical protein
MFSDLYGYISLLFYWQWPSVEGQVTAVRILGSGRMLVEYRFSLGDRSYTGEASCPWSVGTTAINVSERLSVGQPVVVRYRRDNPSVSKLDRSVWQALDGL